MNTGREISTKSSRFKLSFLVMIYPIKINHHLIKIRVLPCARPITQRPNIKKSL